MFLGRGSMTVALGCLLAFENRSLLSYSKKSIRKHSSLAKSLGNTSDSRTPVVAPPTIASTLSPTTLTTPSISASIGSGAAQVGESLGLKAINALSEGTVGVVAGFVPNPHLATLFTGMDMRSFNFTIQCTATSPEDSAALQRIITMIKKYSLPSISEKRISLSYPHEVFISFSEAGYANPPRTPLDKIFSFKRCVLKGINITVGSQGTPSFFNNLEPTELTIDLEFTETEIETANDFGGSASEDLSTQAARAATDGLAKGKKLADESRNLAASRDKEGS